MVNKYNFGFTAGNLFVVVAPQIAKIYLTKHDWDLVRSTVIDQNLLQARAQASLKRLTIELVGRLKVLSDPQLELLVAGSIREQRQVLWLAACKQYLFVREFAEEVLRDKYLRYSPRLSHQDYDIFFNNKAESEDHLQRLTALINLDLPWNPTRLEQRKGRIQRIGQLRDTVKVYNMRYKDSVEDRVHELLSERLNDIFNLFGQLPDVLEDVWVNTALGKLEEARQVIDLVPREHPFTLKNTEVQPVDWESCGTILSERDMRRVLSKGWAG